MVIKIDLDKITSYVYKALDVLFMTRPEKTSFGLLLGTILLGGKEAIVSVATGGVQDFIENLKWYSLLILGVLIVRLDVIFYKEPLDKVILAKLNTVRIIIDESNLSDFEKRQVYRQLINTVVKNMKAQDDEDTSQPIEN